jgi:hypothetical protein
MNYVENMIPWERDVYVELLNGEIEKRNSEILAQNQK